jgi:energy-coupling factor transport system permease protein
VQNPKIRMISAAVLSVAAFVSINGAVATFLWWLLFVPKERLLPRLHLVIPAFVMVGIAGILSYITAGAGFVYVVKMAAILLIGIWLYAEQRPGEFLNVCVSLLGNKFGFDLGLTGEMALNSLKSAEQEIAQVQRALAIKGIPWGVRSIIPVGRIIVKSQITRAEVQSALLAVRGYSGGGLVCPKYTHDIKEIVAGSLAICIGIFGFVSVREFFIL